MRLLLDIASGYVVFVLLWVIYSFFAGPVGCKWPEIAKGSYISSIETTTYGDKKIKKMLDTFNSMGHNSIVSYEGTRPITITEVENITHSRSAIGLARIQTDRCDIEIESGLKGRQLEAVLIHEYLHCMGFGEHSWALGDLMFFSATGLTTTSNVRAYAEYLEEILSGKF